MARTSPRMLRWLARQRAAGLQPVTAFLPRGLTATLAAYARRHQVAQSVVVEAVLTEGLRLFRPSTVQAVQRRRRSSGEGATSSSLPMKKNADAGA